MIRLALALLALLFVAGCPVTGNNYPATYARTACASVFLCVEDPNEIETWFGYDDEDECIEDQEEQVASSPAYDAYEEGDREFDADNANACLDEIDQIRDDSDCGTMSLGAWLIDAAAEECSQVFVEPEEE